MHVLLILIILKVFIYGTECMLYRNKTCGVDGSPASAVYQGEADIRTYPWMGLLYYPLNKKFFTTVAVLVTRQMAICSAVEIDKMPKMEFRARARVAIGRNCSEGGIRIRDYTYHPDFLARTISALAIVQLDIDHVKQELQPICPPPDHFIEPTMYAMTLTGDCSKPRVRVFRMQYLPLEQCQTFYRRFELNEESIWPRDTTCARALSSRRCVWRSGSVLAIKHDGRWRLLGFSIFGPGCGAPSRYVDYGRVQAWVRRRTANIGRPALTRIADNHLVLRRASSSIQRFGPCEFDEMEYLLYTDRVQIKSEGAPAVAVYNVSLFANVEYTCVTFIAEPDEKVKVLPKRATKYKESSYTWPKLRLRRWCAGPAAMCHGFQLLEIKFYVEITFTAVVYFNVRAYGKQAKIIDPALSLKKTQRRRRPTVPHYHQIISRIDELKEHPKWAKYKWFHIDNVGKYIG